MKKFIYDKKFIEEKHDSYVKTTMYYFLFLLFFIFVILILVGYRVYFVGGWSMQPTIDYMDLIIVNQGVDKYNLEIGDIVTFEYGIVNTHRIIKVNYDSQRNVVSYTTKGDNPNITQQETFSPDKVIGKIVTIFDAPIRIPHLGYTVMDMQNNKFLIIFYIVIMYLFFAMTPKEKDYINYQP